MPKKNGKGHGKLSPSLDPFDPQSMNELESKLHAMALASHAPNWKGPVGISIPPSGSITPIAMDFERAQKAVGGYVEVVRLRSGNIFLVDEEGLLKGYELNSIASLISKKELVGTVVFLPKRYVKKVLG